MPRPTRKFLASQLKLQDKQPAISIDYVIVRADDQLVLGFRSGHSAKQARRFFLSDYRIKSPRGPLPDITAIEMAVYTSEARKHIKAGQTYEWQIERI